MSLIRFTKAELAAAISRGVRQCVFIGPKPVELGSSLPVFEVGESRTGNSDAAFVHTEFASESLEVALQKSEFDRLKSTLVVWVGSTGPFAVHRIDPKTNKLVATVKLGGEPCAGMAAGFGSLWVPLCGHPSTLARVDLKSNALTTLRKVGPAGPEGGIATSDDGVWMVLDKAGKLARLDPVTGAIRKVVRVPPGSFNPIYRDGLVWVTRAKGSEITSVDAAKGTLLTSIRTGPGPRFLNGGDGKVWTLNQGDGSLTSIDTRTGQAIKTVALGTPGAGGDVAVGGGMVWTTMPKVPLTAVDEATGNVQCQWVGPGGDSLAIGHDSIWLTDYSGGTISRIDLADAKAHCSQKAGA